MGPLPRTFQAVLQLKTVNHLNIRRCRLQHHGAPLFIDFMRRLPKDHHLQLCVVVYVQARVRAACVRAAV